MGFVSLWILRNYLKTEKFITIYRLVLDFDIYETGKGVVNENPNASSVRRFVVILLDSIKFKSWS